MKSRGCFAYVLASAAKLAHAHYIQASRAGWSVLNPQVVGIMYVDSACLHTNQPTGIISLGPFIYFPCL